MIAYSFNLNKQYNGLYSGLLMMGDLYSYGKSLEYLYDNKFIFNVCISHINNWKSTFTEYGLAL